MKYLSTLISGFKSYKTFFIYWLQFLVIGALFRIFLIFIFADIKISLDSFFSIIYGFRMDTIIFSGLTIAFVFLFLFNLTKILKILLSVLFFSYLFLEIATVMFMQNFLSRPDYLFIEHLSNINELFFTVWNEYYIYIIISLPIIIYLSFKVYKYFDKTLISKKFKDKIIVLPLILLLLFLGIRSSLGRSTPNQGYYAVSSSNIHNEIANNSLFSIYYANYLLNKEKFYNYGKIGYKDAVSNVKKLNNILSNDKNNNSLIRFQKSLFKKKKNIILVILESFGKKNIGYLGGTDTTPNLDKLTSQSLYFTNMYATGTRTSWGVSALLTSLYRIPSREYIKASKSQKDFYTIARTLKENNYENTFLYSGDVDFDNMKGFLLSNGYDDVIGENGFTRNKYDKFVWGYCDEDLYDEAIYLAEKSKDKPFFLTLLTMSSHEPFDYPENKIDLLEGEKKNSFPNSIKYADYALGKFINDLKEKGLLENTVVAFIADHSMKSYGKFDVPIERYKIASLIVSDNYKNNNGREYDKIASQIDIGPTILDLAGIDCELPTMGTSVLQHERNSALLLANRRNFAYLVPDRFVIYKGKLNTQIYDYRYNKLATDSNLIYDGLSYIYGSKYLYDNKKY